MRQYSKIKQGQQHLRYFDAARQLINSAEVHPCAKESKAWSHTSISITQGTNRTLLLKVEIRGKLGPILQLIIYKY